MSELVKQASAAPTRRLISEQLPGVAAAPTSPAVDTKSALSVAFAVELSELKEEARSEGYLAGYDAGASDAAAHFAEKERELAAQFQTKKAELEAKIQSFSALHDALQVDYTKAIAQLEPQAAAIAFASVCQIAGNAAAFEALLKEVVQHATQSFAANADVSISLAELDAALVLAEPSLSNWHAQIRSDRGLARGSCIVQAGPRCLDASLLTQLDQLRHVLTKVAEG